MEKSQCSQEGGPGRPGGGRHIPGWHLLYRRDGLAHKQKHPSQVEQYLTPPPDYSSNYREGSEGAGESSRPPDQEKWLEEEKTDND